MQNLHLKHKFENACDPCRQRKIKCDRAKPKCEHCTKRQVECTYRPKPTTESVGKQLYQQIPNQLMLFQCDMGAKKTSRKRDAAKADLEKNNAKKVALSSQSGRLSRVSFSTFSSDSDSSDSNFKSPHTPEDLIFHMSSSSSISNMHVELNNFKIPFSTITQLVDTFDISWVDRLEKSFFVGKFREFSSNVSLITELDEVKQAYPFVTSIGGDLVPHYASPISKNENVSRLLESHLIILYFNNINTHFPLIHQLRFFHRYNHSSPSMRPSPLLISSICFATCSLLNTNPIYHINANTHELSHYFHSVAMKLLNEQKEPTIESLQSCMLLYNGECNLIETLNQLHYSWIVKLGLDRIDQLPAHMYPVGSWEREEIVDLWYCIYHQDKVCNFTRGRGYRFHNTNSYFPEIKVKSDNISYLAFLNTIKYSQILSDLYAWNCFCQKEGYNLSFDDIRQQVFNFYNRLNTIMVEFFEKLPQSGIIDEVTGMCTVILRVYYHFSCMALYATVCKLTRHHKFVEDYHLYQYSLHLVQNCLHHASSTLYLSDKLHHQYFTYGPLLKMNTLLLSFSIYRLVREGWEGLEAFGLGRCVNVYRELIYFRTGLKLDYHQSRQLMDNFVGYIGCP